MAKKLPEEILEKYDKAETRLEGDIIDHTKKAKPHQVVRIFCLAEEKDTDQVFIGTSNKHGRVWECLECECKNPEFPRGRE